MNFIRSLISTKDKPELVTIPSGELYHIRELAKRCLFRLAAAHIKKTSTQYNYQLVIERVYEEGEEELEDSGEESETDDEEGNSDEMAFLLDEVLNLSYSVNDDNQIVIMWRDLSGVDQNRFEFVCEEGTKASLLDLFDLNAKKAQYERKYKTPASNASTADLDKFDFEPIIDKHQFKQKPGEEDLIKTKETPIKQEFTKDSVTEDIQDVEGSLMFESDISLHLFDPSSGAFIEKLSNAQLSLYNLGDFDFWLEVDGKGKKFIGVDVTDKMNPVFNYDHLSFIFNFFTETHAFSWLLKFQSYDNLDKFQDFFMQAIWEHKNQAKWTNTKTDDRDYLAESFKEFNIEEEEEYEDSSTDEEEDGKEYSTGLKHEDKAEDYDDDEEYDQVERMDGNGKNSQLAVGTNTNRSFVVRENKIGVFAQTDDNDLKFHATIDNIKTTKGKPFTPSKIQLHTQDSAMILQDSSNLHSLYKMDLEYGKVVEEWDIGNTQAITSFAPSQKFAQLTNEQTILGTSSQSLFRIDPRLAGIKLVDSETKTYNGPIQFSSIGASESGYIAAASRTGEIRLYEKLGTIAKTLLPAMGDAIIGMDVSADGRWILATCETYILLVDTTIKEGPHAGQIGFTRQFGKNNKPIPKRLQVAPEHLAHMQVETGLPLKFTTARFNTGLDSKEQTIVSSTGPYVITWNLKRLFRGDRTPYLIKRYSAKVADDNFKFGSDKNVVIALEDDVGMDDRRTFRRPNKVSITTTAKRIQPLSRDSIVNTAHY